MARLWIYVLVSMVWSGVGTYVHTVQIIEICDNALDDDGDGLIDINDPDCICEMVTLESMVPNPSFEELDCCPMDDSQVRCASSWDQASGGTTDFMHTCGYLPFGEEMMPFPDGDGVLLFLEGTVDNGNGPEIYKEYAGVCLNRTMFRDSLYKFKFYLGFLNQASSPDLRFSFFGSPSCDNLPFSNIADCPTNYEDWFFIHQERVEYPGDGVWVEVTADIRPKQDINALVIGADCSSDPEGMLRTYLIDNLRLSDDNNFDFENLREGSQCDPDYVFEVNDVPEFSYQWYLEGVALLGERFAALSQMYGVGAYQLRIVDNRTRQCRIGDDYFYAPPVFQSRIFETICSGERLFYQGDTITVADNYLYTLTTEEGCDSIVQLIVTQSEAKVDSVVVQKLPGTSVRVANQEFDNEGTFEISLQTNSGCDSTLVLVLQDLEVYISNIFSPNGDRQNDFFEVATSGDDFIIKEISIYNRWGNLLYVGGSWDGTYQNQMSDAGVYTYVIKLIDREGRSHSSYGSVTLIR